MSINFPNADFTPQLAGYTGQGAFRFWCQKVLPIVYDDSLSYYELLNKVVNYLNNVIADVANVEENVGALNDSYSSLQAYVNEHMQELVGVVNQYTEYTDNYFNNLDVQHEIDTKLDEMASDGTLSGLIGPIVVATAPDIISQWLTEHITPTTPIVDDTLTISGAAADAKVTGDKIYDLGADIENITGDVYVHETVDLNTWEQGYNAPSNGSLQDSTTICRTDAIYIGDGYTKVMWPDTYNVRIFVYNSTAVSSYLGRADGFIDWNDFSGNIKEYSGKYIRFNVKYADGSTITPSDISGIYITNNMATDKTLTMDGKAADAKVTGDEISLLKSVINDTLVADNVLTWVQGGYKYGDGTANASTTAIRGVEYISLSVTRVWCDQAYRFVVYVWNSQGTYIGCIQDNGTIAKANNYKAMTEFYPDWGEGYQYKLTLVNNGGGNITPDNGVYVVTETATDRFLSQSGKAADAYVTGRAIDNSIVEYAGGFDWIQGSFRRTDGTYIASAYSIRLSSYLDNACVKITCDAGYHFLLHAYEKATGTYIGHRYPNGLYGTSADVYGFLTEVYLDNTLGYNYGLAMTRTDAIEITPSEWSHCHVYLTQRGYDTQFIETSASPEFVGTPDIIFENDDETAQPGIDAGMLNFVNVVKISDSMYYMYYECCSENVRWGSYDYLRLCFAYSTDGLNFTKGFPAGVEAPIAGTNQLLPTGSTTGHSVVKVQDQDYPFRMVYTHAYKQNNINYREAEIRKSADGVHWGEPKKITNGYNDSQASVVVRGNLLKIFLRTRNEYGRSIGVITTDLDGNRLISRWTNVISTYNSQKQLYTSAASALDDRREILFPTVYNPTDSQEFVGCFIVDGDKCEYKELDMSVVMPNDVKSIYFAPGIVDIGLKTYLFYEARDTDHEHGVIGTTRSSIRRVEITDPTFADVVPE